MKKATGPEMEAAPSPNLRPFVTGAGGIPSIGIMES